MSGSQSSELRCFNENSPRPPVPGKLFCLESLFSWSKTIFYIKMFFVSGEERERQNLRCRATSPDVLPRRSTLTRGQKSSHTSCNAPLGFEPEGRCDNSNVMETGADSLKCLQWSRSLRNLLEDRKGLELFEKFLQQEGHLYTLSFWFACEGLKDERDPDKLQTVTRALFRRYKNYF